MDKQTPPIDVTQGDQLRAFENAASMLAQLRSTIAIRFDGRVEHELWFKMNEAFDKLQAARSTPAPSNTTEQACEIADKSDEWKIGALSVDLELALHEVGIDIGEYNAAKLAEIAVSKLRQPPSDVMLREAAQQMIDAWASSNVDEMEAAEANLRAALTQEKPDVT